VAAAVIAVERLLRLAIAGSRRAIHSHMKVVVVVPPWPHLGKPSAVISRLLAKELLDGGMHEDAINLRIGDGALD